MALYVPDWLETETRDGVKTFVNQAYADVVEHEVDLSRFCPTNATPTSDSYCHAVKGEPIKVIATPHSIVVSCSDHTIGLEQYLSGKFGGPHLVRYTLAYTLPPKKTYFQSNSSDKSGNLKFGNISFTDDEDSTYKDHIRQVFNALCYDQPPLPKGQF